MVRNEQMLEMLEENLAKACGNIVRACHASGCRVRDVNAWASADPAVAARLKEAQMIGWSGLEAEAIRRGHDGVEVPVYKKGELVGYKTEYSDSLLALLIKNRVPGYKEDDLGSRVTVNVNLMPRAENYEQWLEQRQKVLALEDKSTTVEDAEYTEIEITPCLRDL